jgi:NADH-quinone oxidoreductase subunit L
LEFGLAALSVAVALIGLALAYLWYVRKPGTAAALAQRYEPLYELVAHKYFIDEIYDAVFVTGLLQTARLFLKGFDQFGIDGAGRFASWIAFDMSEALRRIQSGNLRSYAGWLAFGAALVMGFMIFWRGF